MPISIKKINEEFWFKIPKHDILRPFFMSIVSDSNHWLFISSNGGLTAGRKNAEHALFPYYSDDKVTDMSDITGSKTIIRVRDAEEEVKLWEPFSKFGVQKYRLSRNLYKNRFGNKVMFEEVNHDLGLSFWYEWSSSNLYGFVRNAGIDNHGNSAVKLEVLDGLQNLLPYGVDSDLQKRQSNLVDAYKRSELVEKSGLGIFALSAIIVDRAEPSEALKANVVWATGIEVEKYLLSSLQLDRFRQGEDLRAETDVKGERGAYFIYAKAKIEAGAKHDWSMVANVNQTQADIVWLSHEIVSNPNLREQVLKNVEEGTQKLRQIVGAADGLELTSDALRDTRHFANVLFNVMRGGIFDYNYQIEKRDFLQYLNNANKALYQKHKSEIDELNAVFDKAELKEKILASGDADLIRLGEEYLPLRFSRRHGDPSRPWNKFSINTNSEVDGSKILDYEGNWRDIFQNWEALAHSYPDFIEGMIFKFLNASTFDGYNPYRITKDGFDWEVSEPDDPWSYIGYWGDHQIIYLLKFLEFYEAYNPDKLRELFDKDFFVYANVPYRIKPYAEIVKNPKDTIEFDEEADKSIRQKIAERGADGALRKNQNNAIHRVSFIEKILVTVLAKVSNFIPEAGIWLNTQRPEWNDANNALVGNGVSMVTLCYLRRFLNFMEVALLAVRIEKVAISEEVVALFEQTKEVIEDLEKAINGPIDDQLRKSITDRLGLAGSAYREKVYNNGFSGEKVEIEVRSLRFFSTWTRKCLQHSIQANQREDKLYHSYNLMEYSESGIAISRLDEMLEGQVAALSSGFLEPSDAVELLDALRQSRLYRKDQNSYLLYPNKELPGFLEKNTIPENLVNRSELLKKMMANGNTQIIEKDVEGDYHFNGNFRNNSVLKEALDHLAGSEYAELAKAEEKLILKIYEAVFSHRAFTGRSGTFFGYEGLGSIYWHMVSKLHLAVGEICHEAYRYDEFYEVQNPLAVHFEEIGEGIGIHKDPELYGAFPTDPYSHTPWHRGAQQPGMTGQVKEDILARRVELGVFIEEGRLYFYPFLLRKKEFLTESSRFEYFNVKGERREIELPENSIAFTVCQVPVIYRFIGGITAFRVELENGNSQKSEGSVLDTATSKSIFLREGKVRAIYVYLDDDFLR